MAIDEPPADGHAGRKQHPVEAPPVSQPLVQQAVVARIVRIADEEVVEELIEHREHTDSAPFPPSAETMAKTDFKSVDEYILSQPVPVKLIERIARFLAKVARERARAKQIGPKKRR